MLQPYISSGVAVERQQKILNTITANPLGSYVFSGPPGVGKTTLLREVERLARATCPKNFAVYSRTAMQYQREVTTAVRGERVPALVSPFVITSSADHDVRWAVFLDDFDKVSGSEFIRLHLFDLVNTICEERNPATQFVLTTNMSKGEFSAFFGDHIAWRVFKHCTWVSMERTP